MQGPALIFLIAAAVAWLAPVMRAMQNGKQRLGGAWLCSAPLGIGLYMLDPHPKVAMGVMMALLIGGGIVWRNTAKD